MAEGAWRSTLTDCGLTEAEIELICGVLERHEAVTGATMFGSRAKGTASKHSDIDIVLEGIDDELKTEWIATELDDLPLPYQFDVHALALIEHEGLREHIDGVGVQIYSHRSLVAS